MKAHLQDDLKVAMKGRDSIRVMTIRGVLSEISRLEKELRREPAEAEIIQILKRERARRDEALGFARQGARAELVEQYEAEARVLDSYIPAAVSAEQVKAVIDGKLAAGVRQIGPIMKALKDEFGARLDSRLASEMVKEALARG